MKHVVALLVVIFVAVQCMPNPDPISLGIPTKGGGEKRVGVDFNKEDGVVVTKESKTVEEKKTVEKEKSHSNYEQSQQDGDKSTSVEQTSNSEKTHTEDSKTTTENKKTFSLGGKGLKASEQKKTTQETKVKDHESGNQTYTRKEADGDSSHITKDQSQYNKDSQTYDKTTEEENKEMGIGLGGKQKVKKDTKKTEEHAAVSKETGSHQHMEAGRSKKDGQEQKYFSGSGTRFSKENAEYSKADTETHEEKGNDEKDCDKKECEKKECDEKECDEKDQEKAKKGRITRISPEVLRELKKNGRRLGLYGDKVLRNDSTENIQGSPGFTRLRNEYLLALAKKIYGSKFTNIGGETRTVDASLQRSNSRTSSQVAKPMPVSSQYANTKMIESRYKNIPSFYVPNAKYSKLRYGNDTHTRFGTVRSQNKYGTGVSHGGIGLDGIKNTQEGAGKSEDGINKEYIGQLRADDRDSTTVESDYGNDGPIKRKPTIAPDVRNAILSQNVESFIHNLGASQGVKIGSKSASFSEIWKKNNLFRKINFNEILRKNKDMNVHISNKNSDKSKDIKNVEVNKLGKPEPVYDGSNYKDQVESITEVMKSATIETNTVKSKKPGSIHDVGVDYDEIIDSNNESNVKVANRKVDTENTKHENGKSKSYDNLDSLPLGKYGGDTVVKPDAFGYTKDNDGSTDLIDSEVNISKTDVDIDYANQANFDHSKSNSTTSDNVNLSTSPLPYIEKYDSPQSGKSVDEIAIRESNDNTDRYKYDAADTDEINDEIISEKTVDKSDSAIISSSDLVHSLSSSAVNNNLAESTSFSSANATADQKKVRSSDINYDESKLNDITLKEKYPNERENNFESLNATENIEASDGMQEDVNNKISNMNYTYDVDVSSSKNSENKSRGMSDYDDYHDLSVIGIEKTSKASAFTTENILNSDNTNDIVNSENYLNTPDALPAFMTSDVSSPSTGNQRDSVFNTMSETTNASNITENSDANLSDIYLEDKSFVDSDTADIETSSSPDYLAANDSTSADIFFSSTNFTTSLPKTISEQDTINMTTEQTYVTSTISEIGEDSTIDIPDSKSEETSTTVTDKASSFQIINELATSNVSPAMNAEETDMTYTTASVDNDLLSKTTTDTTSSQIYVESNSNTTVNEVDNTSSTEEISIINSNIDKNLNNMTQYTNTSNLSDIQSDSSSSQVNGASSSILSLLEADTLSINSETANVNNTDVTSNTTKLDNDVSIISDKPSDDSFKQVDEILSSISSSTETDNSNITSETANIYNAELTSDTTKLDNDTSVITDITSFDSSKQLDEIPMSISSSTEADTLSITSETAHMDNNAAVTSDTTNLDTDTSFITDIPFDYYSKQVDEIPSAISSSTEADTSNVTSETAKIYDNTEVNSDITKLDTDMLVVSNIESNNSFNQESELNETNNSNLTSEMANINANTEVTSDTTKLDTDTLVVSDNKSNNLSIQENELSETITSNITSEMANRSDNTEVTSDTTKLDNDALVVSDNESNNVSNQQNELSETNSSSTEGDTSNVTSETAKINDNTEVTSDITKLDTDTLVVSDNKSNNLSNQENELSETNTSNITSEMANMTSTNDVTTGTTKLDTNESSTPAIKNDYFFSRVAAESSLSSDLSESDTPNITKTADTNNTEVTSETTQSNINTSGMSDSNSNYFFRKFNEEASTDKSIIETDTSSIENADTNGTEVTSATIEPDTDASAALDNKPDYHFSRVTEERKLADKNNSNITVTDISSIENADTNGTEVTSATIEPDTDASAAPDNKPDYHFSKVTEEPKLADKNTTSQALDKNKTFVNADNTTSDSDEQTTSDRKSNDFSSKVVEESDSSVVLAEVNESNKTTVTQDNNTDMEKTSEAVVENVSSNLVIDIPEKYDDTTSKVIDEPSSSTTAAETANKNYDSDIVLADSVTAVTNSIPDTTVAKVESTSVINSNNDTGNSNAGTSNYKNTTVSASVSDSESAAISNTENTTTGGSDDKHISDKPVKPLSILESVEESKSDESRSVSDEPMMGFDFMNQSAYESGSVSSES